MKEQMCQKIGGLTMLDREKVIKGLECLGKSGKRVGNPCEETGMCEYAYLIRDPNGEPYYPYVCNRERLCNDAVTLLKEGEPPTVTLNTVEG